MKEIKINGENWLTLDVLVTNEHGVHVRPASLIAKTISKYDKKDAYFNVLERKNKNGEIVRENSDEKYLCNSIMALVTMNAEKDAKLRLYVKNSDEISVKVTKEIENLFLSDFAMAYQNI